MNEAFPVVAAIHSLVFSDFPYVVSCNVAPHTERVYDDSSMPYATAVNMLYFPSSA